MSNWLLIVYRDWLVHIVHRLKLELLKQRYLHIDETHVQVLKEPGRKNTSDSYMWVYCSIKDAVTPIRYFEYRPGRGGKYPEVFLKGYEGYIHTDAYSGYNAVSGVKDVFAIRICAGLSWMLSQKTSIIRSIKTCGSNPPSESTL